MSIKRLIIWAYVLSLMFFSSAASGEPEKILTLQESVRIALKQNLDIKSSEQKIMQKQWEEKDARTEFFPSITGSFAYTKLDRTPSISVPGMPMKIEMNKTDIYNMQITITQPIFTGGALSSQYKLKKEELKITEGEKRITDEGVCMDVVHTYFLILKASNLFSAAEILVNQRQTHLSNVKKLFDAGLATKADILKTEVALADAKQKLIETENNLNLAKQQFKTILSLPLDREINLQDILTFQNKEKKLQEWKDIALKNREELNQIERTLTGLSLAKDITRSRYYPQVAFILNWKDEKGTATGLNDWYQTLSGLITVNIDIWNWHSTRNKMNAIDSQISQIETQKQKLTNLILLEVDSAYLNLSSAENRIHVMEKAVEDAQENLRVTETLKREGMATTTDVIDAQTYLFQARSIYYQALYDYQIAHYQLLKASGRLIPELLAEK